MSGWQARAASLGCVHKAMPNDRVGSKGCVRTVQSSTLLCNGDRSHSYRRSDSPRPAGMSGGSRMA